MSAERVLETFLELVRIDSPTGFEAACAAYCATHLERLGFTVRFDESASQTGSDTGNLIAELPGTRPGVLAFSAHMDCVEPCRGVEPAIVDGIIAPVGPTILGADDKTGLACALEAFERLVESGEPRPGLKAIFTVQEEVGLVGAKHLSATDVACDLCLVLDAEGAPGAIVTAAPTHYTFAAEFTGRASHAGVAPELGVSAILMATDAVRRMRLGRLDESTTANVGTIRGGTATNVIPARVEMTGECRSLHRQTVEALKAEMDEALHAAALDAGGSVEVIWRREYEGFCYDDDDALVELAAGAVRDAGLVPSTFRTGGGSDANVLAGKGVAVLALACGMQGVHSTSEQLAVADLESLTSICVAVGRRLAAGAV
jgi:tripeptide aminopeptidase